MLATHAIIRFALIQTIFLSVLVKTICAMLKPKDDLLVMGSEMCASRDICYLETMYESIPRQANVVAKSAR